MSSETKTRWTERYDSGDLPWDTKRADRDLIQTVREIPIKPCRALDIGCGLGTNAIWLAEQGFDAVGVDIAPNAIEGAKARAAESGTEVTFLCRDITQDTEDLSGFEFVFDRGCLHSMKSSDDRSAFVQAVHAVTAENALWFSIIGNADDTVKDHGPPRWSLREVVEAVEPCFEIQSVRAQRFDSDTDDVPLGWMMVVRRRSSI